MRLKWKYLTETWVVYHGGVPLPDWVWRFWDRVNSVNRR